MKQIYFFFTILLITQQVFAQPANDDCSNAEIITISATSITIPFDINTATLNNETICTTTTDFADVWYEFTMPYNGNVYVDGTLAWNNFALYNACGGTAIECENSNVLFTNLISGNTYFLRVYRTFATNTNTAYQSFSIKAFAEATNDDCTTAENITVSTNDTTVNFEIGGATVNNEIGCEGGTAQDYVDIWYDFTMPVTGNLYVDGVIGWNNFALYDACGSAQIQCGSTSELFTGLTAGTNYKLRLFRTESNADNSYLSFTIKAFPEVTNDDCATSENIVVSETNTTVNFNIGGATVNNELGCDDGITQDYVDIWYDFTLPFNGNVYVDGVIGWNNFALFDACSGTEIQCGNANEFFTGLASGTNYKLRLFRTRANADNSYLSFTIKAFQEATNDDCASAENITVSTDLSTVNFAIGGASVNSEIGCAGGNTEEVVDIWYDFTMPVNGNLYVDGVIGWNNFALFDACSGTEIQCGSTNQLFTGLTATTNYKLRLFRTAANADNSYLSFTTQAFEIINNDDCSAAEPITLSPSTPISVSFGIAGAAINNEIGCSGTTVQDYADVWYDVTMPQDGFLLIDGDISWNNFALYDSCGGTELGCFDTTGNIGGLTNGTTYKLRVFRTLALVDNSSYKSFTIESASTLSTTSLELEKSVSLYPNPTLNKVTVSSKHKINNLEVFNLLGQRILQNTSQNTIDLSHFKSGVYLVKIKTDKGEVTKKILKH
ncbi:T9SS type A sorting domain-containing protein [Lacinutrix chionoecetis]